MLSDEAKQELIDIANLFYSEQGTQKTAQSPVHRPCPQSDRTGHIEAATARAE